MSSKRVPDSLLQDLFRLGGSPPNLNPELLIKSDAVISDRIPVVRTLLGAREDVCRTASRSVCRCYNFGDLPGSSAEEKCLRDVSLVFDHILLAIVIDNVNFLEDRMLYWFRKVLDHLDFPGHEESIRAVYTIVRAESLALLDGSERAIVEPFFNRVLEVACRDLTLAKEE